MNNLLLSALEQMQQEYKKKLIWAKEFLPYQNTNIALMELASFWREHKKIVDCALTYLAKPYDRFFFTAATILDVDEDEHVPFLAVGSFRIWDDPIFGYVSSMLDTPSEKFNDKMKKQILETIDDNIKIIDNTYNRILILPVRLLFEDKEESLSIAKNLFFSFFKEMPKDMETYFNKFKTIEDVDAGLHENVKQYICFDTDDEELGLKEKFAKYVANNTLPIGEEKSEVFVFFFSVIGYLMQAINVLILAQSFQMYPYVRFKVSLKYMTVLVSSMNEQPEMRNILDVMWACYILHNKMPKSIGSDLASYLTSLERVNFSQRLLENVRKMEANKTFSLKNIDEAISGLIIEITL